MYQNCPPRVERVVKAPPGFRRPRPSGRKRGTGAKCLDYLRKSLPEAGIRFPAGGQFSSFVVKYLRHGLPMVNAPEKSPTALIIPNGPAIGPPGPHTSFSGTGTIPRTSIGYIEGGLRSVEARCDIICGISHSAGAYPVRSTHFKYVPSVAGTLSVTFSTVACDVQVFWREIVKKG